MTLYGCGLGDKEEKVHMYGGCIYDPNREDIEKRTVRQDQKTIQRTILLDSLGLNKVDFIKMDIEGYEYPALVGATQTILKWKPIICIEQNKSDFKWRGIEEENQALNYLLSLGMRIAKKLNKQDYLMVWDEESKEDNKKTEETTTEVKSTIIEE